MDGRNEGEGENLAKDEQISPTNSSPFASLNLRAPPPNGGSGSSPRQGSGGEEELAAGASNSSVALMQRGRIKGRVASASTGAVQLNPNVGTVTHGSDSPGYSLGSAVGLKTMAG